ncbi:MAG: phosphoribosyl-ATP diphosphatase [Chloroflexaceae bacterium]|nr:phosphoribosyl-ATP diphosphatase [Chloroflexaceae bacterium]
MRGLICRRAMGSEQDNQNTGWQDPKPTALLVLAEPDGPTCHTAKPSCFHRHLNDRLTEQRVPAVSILTRLADTIRQRGQEQSETSYTAKLLRGGVDRIGKKIGEEATEVVIAAKNNSAAELTYEVADLFYHSLVLLEHQQVPLEAIWNELLRRTQPQQPPADTALPPSGESQ